MCEYSLNKMSQGVVSFLPLFVNHLRSQTACFLLSQERKRINTEDPLCSLNPIFRMCFLPRSQESMEVPLCIMHAFHNQDLLKLVNCEFVL